MNESPVVQQDPIDPADSFWGSARDLGLTAVAVLGFAGLVYEYTYLHELGIDFAAVDISPSLSLIAASRVAVANAPWILLALVVLGAIRVVFARLAPKDRPVGRAAHWLRGRLVQTVLVCLASLLVCVLAYASALQSVAHLRNRETFGVHLTFKPDAVAQVAPALVKANQSGDLFLVLDTSAEVFVLYQPKPGIIANLLPIGTVYELSKENIGSLETLIPSAKTSS
jgi:hypothetical protein